MAPMTRTPGRMTWMGLLATVVSLTACDTLRDPLTVEPASRIPAQVAEVPANAQLLSDGAIADFECAFNAYAAMSGIVGEEFIYAQQTASRTPYDRRNTSKDDADYAINSCTSGSIGVYTPLQVARASNENLIRLLNLWTDAEVSSGAGQPNRTNLLAIASTYAGYSFVLLGEGFCSMAISYVNPDNSITFGGEISRDSVFRLAVARFSEAITAAGTSNTIMRNTAYLGRARAKLNLADYAGAKADAQQVPAGFLRTVTASDANTRRQNRIFMENSSANRALSVGEPYRALNDPRVPVTATTTVSATGITHFFQTKYATSATALPLSTYEEAQLIIAEADIRTNTVASLASARTILDASRARGNQGAFTGVTAAEFTAELISQRRRELFAESHHLGDIIRYNIPLTPAVGSAYHFGGTYGTQICLPLPAAERQNNPKIGS